MGLGALERTDTVDDDDDDHHHLLHRCSQLRSEGVISVPENDLGIPVGRAMPLICVVMSPIRDKEVVLL